jgi:hypothetical protein
MSQAEMAGRGQERLCLPSAMIPNGAKIEMNTESMHLACASRALVILSLCLIGKNGGARTYVADLPTPAFEVVSFKHVGNVGAGRTIRALRFKGVKLSGEVPLFVLLEFAFSPLVKPYHAEFPDWGYN